MVKPISFRLHFIFTALLACLLCVCVHTQGFSDSLPAEVAFNRSYGISPDSLVNDGIYKVKIIDALMIPGGYLLTGYTMPPARKTKVSIVTPMIATMEDEGWHPIKFNKIYTLNLRLYFEKLDQLGASFHYPSTLNIILLDSVLCLPMEGQYSQLYFSPNISGLCVNESLSLENSSIDSNTVNSLSAFLAGVMKNGTSFMNHVDTSATAFLFSQFLSGQRSAIVPNNGRKIITSWTFQKYVWPGNDDVTNIESANHILFHNMYDCMFQLESMHILYVKNGEYLLRTTWNTQSLFKEIIFHIKWTCGKYQVAGFCFPYLIPSTVLYN